MAEDSGRVQPAEACPMAFKLKYALLPALQCSVVHWSVDGETEQRISRWSWVSFSGNISPHTDHFLD